MIDKVNILHNVLEIDNKREGKVEQVTGNGECWGSGGWGGLPC